MLQKRKEGRKETKKQITITFDFSILFNFSGI